MYISMNESIHVTLDKVICMSFYQSSMCIACAASSITGWGQLLLMLWRLVVVGIGENQTLRGRGRRWFSSSNHRLLQQGGEVQTVMRTISKDN